VTTADHTGKHGIVVFPSTHFALRAEKIARAAGIPVKMVPVPRDISADCNMGMKVSGERALQLQALLADKGVVCELVMR